MKQSSLDTLKTCKGKDFRRRVGIRRRELRHIYQKVRAYCDDLAERKPLSRREKNPRRST